MKLYFCVFSNIFILCPLDCNRKVLIFMFVPQNPWQELMNSFMLLYKFLLRIRYSIWSICFLWCWWSVSVVGKQRHISALFIPVIEGFSTPNPVKCLFFSECYSFPILSPFSPFSSDFFWKLQTCNTETQDLLVKLVGSIYMQPLTLIFHAEAHVLTCYKEPLVRDCYLDAAFWSCS